MQPQCLHAGYFICLFKLFMPWFICTLLLRALCLGLLIGLFPLLKAIWHFRLSEASYELSVRLFLLWSLLLSAPPQPYSELFPMIPVLGHHKTQCPPSAYYQGTDQIEVDAQFLPFGDFLQGKKRPRVHALEPKPCTLSHSRCSINTRMKKSALKAWEEHTVFHCQIL